MPNWTFRVGHAYKRESYARNNLYFGIEIELAATHHATCVSGRADLPVWLDVGRDSSIICDSIRTYAIEVRTHPATRCWYRQNKKQLCGILDSWKKDRCVSDAAHCCGVHIHFSRVISDDHLMKFMQVIYQNPKEILHISGRSAANMRHWSKRITDMDDGRGIQCSCSDCTHRRAMFIKLHQLMDEHGVCRRVIRHAFDNGILAQKYSVVHVLKNTVEVRLFTGTLGCETLYAYLEFVISVLDYTSQFKRLKTSTAQFDAWLAWVAAQDDYAALRGFLTYKGYIGGQNEHSETTERPQKAHR